MATHSSILAWEIPLTEEPGELQSMGSKKFEYDLAMDFPGSSAGKESACNAGDAGLIPGSERSTGGGIGYPLQYSDLENFRDCIVHGVAKSWTRLSHFN